ncbi:hypothetical protein N7508_007793 [Penicillium antarcticum]|uniref:uncharacterized protein n=1 Tax=Penicillium antarcticum TaxID=416450 RepID=UPI00238ACE28|nr:uncharacterized protein N7508_007793 [Penicillium antarcticum]KAJ5297544.1 hypothetical protein N7508_007793 [Penicillium antarcticum]
MNQIEMKKSKSSSLLRHLRLFMCLAPPQTRKIDGENIQESFSNNSQCDEKKPACSKCVHHSIECDFQQAEAALSASPSSAPSPSVSSQGPKGRFRFKPSKYQPKEPTPDEAIQPSTQTISTEIQPNNQTPKETITFTDLRLFHHFVTETYRTLADQATDKNRIWQHHLPQWGFSTPSIFHLILTLAALHLAHLHPEKKDQYILQADSHFTFGIRSVTAILSSLNEENCQLIYMSAVMICFVYFGHGPRTGEYLIFSETGKAEWLVLMRGVRLILMSSHDKIFSGVLAVQPDPSIAGVSPEFQDELRLHRSHIEDVQRFIEVQVGETPACEIYVDALVNLAEIFDEAYCIRSAGKDGANLMHVVVGWIYRRPEEFIGLLESKDPFALIVVSYWCVLLKFMGSSWLMTGWDRHVIAGIQRSLVPEFHCHIEWPVGVICS